MIRRWTKGVRDSGDADLLAILERHAGVGLWDAVLRDGDPGHPGSHWHWSSEFRRLLGFSDVSEFPDVMSSWADRLHPDDTQATFDAFQACLNDSSGKTGYDVVYRLSTRDQGYRWFRAVGGVARDHDGKPIRACGSLIDIHDQRMAEEERRTSAQALAAAFQESVLGVVDGLSSVIQDVRVSSDQVLAKAHQAQQLSAAVSTASDQTTNNIQTIATAAEQLSASISEIGRQVADATRISSAASVEAAATNGKIGALAQAADRIGTVVSLINVIASQTNLLALNATIEAARAGDAGKGFAVVAGEVKALANQTARATEEIGEHIGAIQDETRRAVEAIRHVALIIGQVQDISVSIAASIQQQGAATHEIAVNVQQAVNGSMAVYDNIKEMDIAVKSTEDDASMSSECVHKLNMAANELVKHVDNFMEYI